MYKILYKQQVHVPSASTRTVLRISPRPLLSELMGESFSLCFQKQRGCQGGFYVLVNTESVGSRSRGGQVVATCADRSKISVM